MTGLVWVSALGWTLVAIGSACLLRWAIGRSGRGQRHCPSCHYDMTGTPGLKCPECGRTARSGRSLRRRRRPRALLWIGIPVAVLGAGVLVFNPNRRDGWAASVPDWALWRMVAWFDADLPGAIARVQSSPPARWERALRARQRVRAIERKLDPSRYPDAAMRQAVLAFAPELKVSRDGDEEPGLVAFGVLDVIERSSDEADAVMLMNRLTQLTPLDHRAVRRLRGIMSTGPTWLAGFPLLQRSTVDRTQLHDVIVPALDHPDWRVRREAALWLGHQEAAGAFALDKLESMRTNDPDDRVRQVAQAAISSIRPAK